MSKSHSITSQVFAVRLRSGVTKSSRIRYAFEHFHKLLARSQNALRGRWENFWASEQTCVVKLVGRDAVLDKLVYTATNPVADHLVERAHHWPGVNGLSALLNGRPLRATRPLHFLLVATLRLRADRPDMIGLTQSADRA